MPASSAANEDRPGFMLRGHHGAVDRRDVVGVAEVEFCEVDQRLVEFHRAFIAVDDKRLIPDLLPRERISCRMPAQTREIGAIFFEDRLVAQKLTGILVEPRLIRPRINLGADLSRLHLVTVIASEILDRAGDARTDDNGPCRIDRPYRRHGARHQRPRVAAL